MGVIGIQRALRDGDDAVALDADIGFVSGIAEAVHDGAAGQDDVEGFVVGCRFCRRCCLLAGGEEEDGGNKQDSFHSLVLSFFAAILGSGGYGVHCYP